MDDDDDDEEVALQIRVDYNAPPHFGYAEGHHLSPLPCMREKYYPRKDTVVPRLQNGTRVANLQRGRASIYQAHKGPEPHELSVGSQLVVLVVVSFTLASCIANAQLVNETAGGGTAIYSYVEEQDVLTSPGRQDALRLLGEKCPAGYRISREGEVPRVDQAVDRAWMGQVSRDGQVSREKRWAIQFTCK
jgi:hypothetical protein